MSLKEAVGPIPNAEALRDLYQSCDKNENLVNIPFFENLWLELKRKEKESFWKSCGCVEEN